MAEVTERDREAANRMFFLCGSLGDFDAACAFLAEWREARMAESEAARQTMAVAMQEAIDREVDARLKAEGERDEARDWVRRMHAESQTLTCVYCGHAYPPGTSASGESVLTEHIKVCEKHPMRQAEARLRAVIEAADAVLSALNACESNRGCFSTAGQHDYRCPYLPPSIAVVPESCECGRTLLDEALAHYRKVRDDGR